jgi:hypothetical protein
MTDNTKVPEWMPSLDPPLLPRTTPASATFNPVIGGISLSEKQKEYIQEQERKLDDERYFLERILGDYRDLMHSIYQYEMRDLPDSENPLFTDSVLKNYVLQAEARSYMRTLVRDYYTLFNFEYEPDVEGGGLVDSQV